MKTKAKTTKVKVKKNQKYFWDAKDMKLLKKYVKNHAENKSIVATLKNFYPYYIIRSKIKTIV